MAHVQRIDDPEKTARLVRVRYRETGREALKTEQEADALESAGLVIKVMKTAALGHYGVER